MADPPRKGDAGNDAAVRPEPEETSGLAPWQKVVGIIGLVVVLLVVIGFLIGGHTPPIQHGTELP
jgi:hypothetical protein